MGTIFLDICFYSIALLYSIVQAMKPEGVAGGVLTFVGTVVLNRCLNGSCMIFTLVIMTYLAIVMRFISCYLFRGPKSGRQLGKWAIIAGSMDEIGTAVAIEYAKKGLNIILIGQSQKKLNEVKSKVRRGSRSCEVDTLEVDFMDFTDEKQKALAWIAEKYAVRILVNVGMGYPDAMLYHETTVEMQQNYLRLDCESMALVTRLVLPTMKKTKHGFVVNISSGASILPHTFYVGYASCKAYVKKFTDEMNREYNKHGIFFQCQIPLRITSDFRKNEKPSLTVASPSQYASACNAHFGHPGVVSPFFMHAVILLLIEFVPSFFTTTYICSMHRSLRQEVMMTKGKGKKTK